MADPVREITFVGVGKEKSTKPAPSAATMPGWKVMSSAIKDIIETSGIPVALIAKNVNLSPQYIYSMMNGTCNPSMDKIEAVMKEAGTPLAQWLEDKAMYGRERRLHDQLQLLLNEKGTNALAIRRAIEALVSFSTSNSEINK